MRYQHVAVAGLFVIIALLGSSSRTFAYERKDWMCTGSADWPSRFSADIWGTQCVSPNGGTYGQIQAQLVYNTTELTHIWLYAWEGGPDDEKCNGVVSCSSMFWYDDGRTVNGPSRTPGQEPGFDVGRPVKSMQIQCFCN